MSAEQEKQNMFASLGIGNDTAGYIGGGLAILGGIGALSQKGVNYGKVNRDIESIIGGILPAFDKNAEEADKALTADLAGYTERTVGAQLEGLKARGITSLEVATETASKVKSELSGAYAAAHAALSRAKLSANSALSGVMATYNMELADRQYKSALANYQAKMGIWGSLGGGATGILGAALGGPAKQPAPQQDYLTEIENAPINEEQFKMKGVKDAEPFRMKGVV